MFATLIPLFDENMAVKAFSLFSQKENFLLNPSMLGTGAYSGVGSINGLEVIENTGIETLSKDADIFIPVNNASIFADIEEQCKAPAKRIVILMDNTVKPEKDYLRRIDDLKKKGYRFAIRKLLVADFENYRDIIGKLDFILLDHKRIDISKAKIYFTKLFPNVKLCAINIETQEIFEELKAQGGYTYYEGPFYRIPITKGTGEVAPVKMTYIELMNVVNGPDFDLTKAADVIGRDTALVVSLLKMVNRMAVNSEITSIRHAAAMLGQKELKRWINTAVTNKLCEDSPGEVTRLSLIRAKFAENLAPLFDEAGQSQELFLMGLFSILDVVLNKPMEEALKIVRVSKAIELALTKGEGEFGKILKFIRAYEDANWTEVSRVMVLDRVDMDAAYSAYLDALKWYRTIYAA